MESPLEPAKMSVAIKQLIATYEEQVEMTGMTPQLEIQLERLRAQLQTDEVGRTKVAERKADETASARKKVGMWQEQAGKELICRACQEPFFMTENQSNFFQSLNLAEPKTCKDCRSAKKAARFMLPCLECETEFEFTPADQTFYAAQGWGQPKRCAECRANKMQPQSLCCVECKKGFNFSVASQKHFKAQGWKPPPRCHFCREAKKALKNVAPVAEAHAFAAELAASDAEALRIVEEAFAQKPAVEFGFALPEGPPPAIFSGSSATQ